MNLMKLDKRKLLCLCALSLTAVYCLITIFLAILTMSSHDLGNDILQQLPELRQEKYKFSSGHLRGCDVYSFERCDVINVSTDILKDEDLLYEMLRSFKQHESSRKGVLNILRYEEAGCTRLVLSFIKPRK